MKSNPTCRVCDVELNEENWYSSYRKNSMYTCKECSKECQKERLRLWREANPAKILAYHTRYRRKKGHRPFKENRECASYLGVHIAEQVLSQAFKNVERMPYGHPGYDFICNKGKKIDVKSSCQRKDGYWLFNITHNTTADFFLCLAFDNREDLTPLHAWLIPGDVINHLMGASISQSTIHKWDPYRLDISKISDCCDAMK